MYDIKLGDNVYVNPKLSHLYIGSINPKLKYTVYRIGDINCLMCHGDEQHCFVLRNLIPEKFINHEFL